MVTLQILVLSFLVRVRVSQLESIFHSKDAFFVYTPEQKEKHTSLLRISNPQSPNRLGHFFTPDFKTGETPSGLAFLISNPAGRLADLRS